MANNFKCSKCGKEYFVIKHSTSIIDGNIVNKGSNGEILICENEDCLKNPLSSISKFDGGVPFFGKVASMSKEDKQNLLKKRSKEHFNKEIKEKQHEMHREMKNGLLGK